MLRNVLALVVLVVLVGAAQARAQSLPSTVVAYVGQAAAGVPGATYSGLGPNPRLGAAGHVAFNGAITGDGVTPSNDFAYWVGKPSELQVAIRQDTANSGPEVFLSNTNVGVDAEGGLSVWTSLASPVPLTMNERLSSYLPNGNGGNTTVVLEGTTPAPGFGSGATFAMIRSTHASNDAGAVAFSATAQGGDAVATSDFGLFAGTPGALQLIAREGAPAPGATGTAPVFRGSNTSFYDKRINASGQVGFAAALSGAGVTTLNDRIIYVWSPGGGSLQRVVQSGDVAPGTSPTTTFWVIDDKPGFNDAGKVVFRGHLTSGLQGEVTSANNYGIWAGGPGDVQLVMRSGDAAPIAGLSFRTPEAAPRINAAGQTAFFSNVVGAGVTAANDRVMCVAGDGAIATVAREGAPAPGAGAGVNFGLLDPTAVINDVGQVVLTATLSGTGVTGANDRGLWAGLPGSLALVAREGDTIDVDPGDPVVLKTVSEISFASGVSIDFESPSAAFNDAGQIAWRALFTDLTTAIMLSTVPLPTLSADFDGDLDVDGDDLARWRTGAGARGNALHVQGDADYDFDVDGNDFLVWQRQLGMGPAGAAVPEPGATTLAAIALAAWPLLIAKEARQSLRQTRRSAAGERG